VFAQWFAPDVAVIPIIVGPLQVLMALLPVILVAVGSALVALFKPRTIKLLLRLLWRVKGTALLFVAVAAGLWFGVSHLRAGGASGAADAGSTNNWAVFRGNIRRTGCAPGSESPAAGRVNWSFSEYKTIYSSPAVAGNRVYISTAEKGPFTDRGAIYCLDADSGAVVWKAVPDRYLATYSSPSVWGRYLVVGEGLHTTRDARILCLDRERNGATLWAHRTRSHVESSPVIADGRVYIGAGDDGYYCLRIEPDASGSAVVEWHLSGENYRDAETSPSVADGRVFFGLGVGGHALVCADAASGRELWRAPTPAPVFTPPALADGKVFIGMGHGNVILSEEEVIAETRDKLKKSGKTDAEVAALTASMNIRGAVWCIDQSTNRVLWRFETDRTVLGGVAVEGDRVFAATRAGTVYGICVDGREVARWDARVPVIAAPAATAKIVYIVATDGRLYGLDRNTLQPVWQVALGSGQNYVSSPAVARGHVYVGTTDNGLLCAGEPGGRDAGPVWEGERGGGMRSGCADGSAVPDAGAMIWLYPQASDEAGTSNAPAVTGPMAVCGNNLYVPMQRLNKEKGLACLEVQYGKQVDPKERWFHVTGGSVVSAPAADAELVFFVNGGTGAENRRINCVRAETGAGAWSKPLAETASGALTLTADSLLAQDAAGSMACFARDGAERWRTGIGGELLPCAVGEDIVVAATVRPAQLMAVDREGGAILWRREAGGLVVAAPVLAGRLVLLATDQAVAAFSLVDGSVRWTAKAGPPAGAVACGGDVACYAVAGNGLVIVGLADGAVKRTVRDAIGRVSPLVSRDSVLYAAGENLMLLRLDAEKPVAWMDVSWLGSIVSPPVMSESTVFFGSDRYGAVCAGKGRQ
jgi:outer membrane protein assembly factor BamB